MKFLKGCLTVVGGLFALMIVLGVVGTMMQSPEEKKAIEQQVEQDIKQEAAKEQAKEAVKEAEAKKAAAPAPLVSAAQILKDYDNNKLKAENTYKGKKLRIKGIVTSIGSDMLGKPYVTIGTGEAFEVVSLQCFFSKKDEPKLAKLDKGQSIVAEGKIDDFVMNIIVQDCSF